MIKEIKGNLLDTHCKLIAHGVNAQGIMGSGVAKALYTKWPEIKTSYRNYSRIFSRPDMLLGSVHITHLEDDIKVANCFTQQNYGSDGQIYLSYKALAKCIEDLYKYAVANDYKEIAMPRIGCGLAGGNWTLVKEMLKTDALTINVYYLE